jgi:tight adherence protein C
MIQNGIIALSCFTICGAAALVLVSRFFRRNAQASRRLREEAGAPKDGADKKPWLQGVFAFLPSLGNPLAPRNEKDRGWWKERMARAGIARPEVLPILLGTKAFLTLLGPAAGAAGYALGLPLEWDLLITAAVSGLGMTAPGLWLDWRAARRRTVLRRGLPDALDMLVMCLEGGLSLSAALPRVRAELQNAHPELASELALAEREMMMGLSAGEALRKVGERIQFEELRSLSGVLIQSQRYGASVSKAMRTYADAMRTERQHRIEERAQKAAVKILFPTLLCIFPAIFVVVLGPAAYQIRSIFSHMKK